MGTEVVTITLRARKDGDIIKVIASQNSTVVNVTRKVVSSGVIINDPGFTLNANQFRELLIEDFSLIQSNHPIGEYQFSRSLSVDDVINSDPFMLSVPPHEQYRDSYTVAPAPFILMLHLKTILWDELHILTILT